MTERVKRRRLATNQMTTSAPRERKYAQSPSAAATAEDQQTWKGFCEIESDPAFFNVMLRDFGVQGVKVQEVVSLDESLLDMLPKPVYGLIFLFRWKEEDNDTQEVFCPEGVWFANQTSPNACASVALLNIVNNVPNLELGEQLQRFKDFTMDFPPALRGDQIGNFDFVKSIHNSFARKMDMLNADLHLKNEATASKKQQGQKKSAAKNVEGDDSAGFHFIAFLPVDGDVWKLDGLDRQPHRLGPIGDQLWLQLARPDIEEKMAQYEGDQIQFGLLALVQDPLMTQLPALAMNVKALATIEAKLEAKVSEWKESAMSDSAELDALIKGPDAAYQLTQEAIDSKEVPVDMQERLAGEEFPVLLDLHYKLVREQYELRRIAREEEHSRQSDNERASARRHDYGPMIQEWIRMLSDKGVLEGLLDEADEA
ncbi:MAG: hypothetical protein M1817_004217 [Caeruleum heppii]|nr:MAG: hypothetical protein M1817_004217 [Caeruleum heppii]